MSVLGRPGVCLPGRRPPLHARSRAFLVACALAVLPVAAQAQPAPAAILEGLRPVDEILPLEMPPMASAFLAATVGAADPDVFADPYEVDVSPASHGRWETTSDGQTAVWRLRVASAGAVSLNFGFTRYRMPEGGRLRVLTPDGSEVVGPYTEADNETHGQLWTPLVSGDEAVIEVAVPVSRLGELDLKLGSVNRGFRDILNVSSSAHDLRHRRGVLGSGFLPGSGSERRSGPRGFEGLHGQPPQQHVGGRKALLPSRRALLLPADQPEHRRQRGRVLELPEYAVRREAVRWEYAEPDRGARCSHQ